MASLINLNHATVEELLSLPGMNPERAELILAGRPYQAVEDLREVKGLGKGAYKKIRDLVVVEQEGMLAALLAEPQALEQTGEASPESMPELEAVDLPVEMLPPPISAFSLPEAVVGEGDSDERPSDEAFEERLHLNRIAQVESAAVEVPQMMADLPQMSELSMAPDGPVESHLPSEFLPAAVEAAPPAEPLPTPAPLPQTLAMMVVPAPRPIPPPPPAPAAAPKPQTGIGRLELAAWLAATMVFSVLLGVGLTLGALALINRGLVYASAEQGNALVETVNALNELSTTTRQDVETLKTQVGALQTVNSRLDSLNQDLAALHTDLDAMGARTKTVESHLAEMDDQVLDLQDQARAATRFFNGLRTLLDEIK